MTANQIAYQRLKEDKRHNVVGESQHQSEIYLDERELTEKIRHNMSDEQIRNLLALIEQGKLRVEEGKLNWDKEKFKLENDRQWSKLIGDWAYTVLSKMPLDATQGFANFGRGIAGIAAL